MAGKAPEKLRGHQPTRLETFVDAAFAFALTMLVISVDSLPQTFDELADALRRVPGFAASFLILVMFWHGHYRWSRRYGLEDTPSVVLSLLLVFLVLVFLYPLRLLMSGAFHSFTGGWLPSEIRIERASDLRALFALYGIAFASMSGTLALLFQRARTVAIDPPLNPYERSTATADLQAWLVLAAMGVASTLLALVLPSRYLGLAVWLYASLAVVMPLLGRYWERKGREAAAACA